MCFKSDWRWNPKQSSEHVPKRKIPKKMIVIKMGTTDQETLFAEEWKNMSGNSGERLGREGKIIGEVCCQMAHKEVGMKEMKEEKIGGDGDKEEDGYEKENTL